MVSCEDGKWLWDGSLKHGVVQSVLYACRYSACCSETHCQLRTSECIKGKNRRASSRKTCFRSNLVSHAPSRLGKFHTFSHAESSPPVFLQAPSILLFGYTNAMSKVRVPKSANNSHLALKSTTPAYDELSDAEDSDVDMDKDETELQLERLVFGDDAAFKKELALHGDAKSGAESAEGEEEDDDDRDLDAVVDADVHYYPPPPKPKPL